MQRYRFHRPNFYEHAEGEYVKVEDVDDAFARFHAASGLYAAGPGEYTERWECRVCGPPCRVEIQTSDEKLPDYLKKDNDRFRRRECFCNKTTPRWVHLPSEKVRESLGSLLAVIHRDGGHHTSEVGVEQSAEDAEGVWVKRQTEIERLKQERDKWKACAESYLPGAKPVLTGKVCRALRMAADEAGEEGG